MALIDDEVAVVGEELRARVSAADRLGGDDVDVAAEVLRLAAELAECGVGKESGESFAPLGGDLHVGDDDGGGNLAVCDQCAGHDGLACAGRGDEVPRVLLLGICLDLYYFLLRVLLPKFGCHLDRGSVSQALVEPNLVPP